MPEVVWPEHVTRQLEEIIDYIGQSDRVAAGQIGARLFALGESLDTFPHRGRPAGNGVRELTGVPPFVLRYAVRGDLVTILGIRHGARSPDTR